MAQYSLAITGAGDESKFTLAGDTAADDVFEYINDGGVNAVRFSSIALLGKVAYLNELASSSVLDVYARVRWSSAGSSTRTTGVAVRINFVADTNSTQYHWGGNDDTTHNLIRQVDGADSIVASASGQADADFYIWVRVKVSGDLVQTKSWNGSVEDEPGIWTAEYTDPSPLAGGFVGIASTTALLTQFIYLSEIYVGTDGDDAPIGGAPPVGTQEMYIKDGGIFVKYTPYVKVGGTFQEVDAYVLEGGTWKPVHEK